MPEYFYKFPKIEYDNKLLTDIISRIKVADKYVDNPDLYYNYIWKDSDRPEIIADKYYGRSELHWIILLCNQIFDATYDFPIDYVTFSNYIESKYQGIGSIRTIKLEEYGDNYIDGTYENVHLVTINQDELSSRGEDAEAKVIIVDNKIDKVMVMRGGRYYDANTKLSINSSDVGGSGAGFVGSIASYMTGIEYSQTSIHPEFGYQKVIRITDPINNDIISDQFYIIDKEQWHMLYDIDPFDNVVTLGDYSKIRYQTLRRNPVTVYEYEEELNEKKRVVKILKEEYAPYFVEQFNRLMGKAYL